MRLLHSKFYILHSTLAFSALVALGATSALNAQPLPEPEVQQAVKQYPLPGAYEKKSAQGLAVYGDNALLFNDTGLCRIYDLKTLKKLAEFPLASAAEHNHANCASFGPEFPKGNKLFPALYVSECWKPYRCFVESIEPKGPRLIQTIALKTGGPDDHVFDWAVDRAGGHIYALALEKRLIHITKLPLPPLEKTSVTFTKADILDQFTVTFPNLTQGAAVRGDYLYMPVGLHDTAKSAKDAPPGYTSREIMIINLKTKKIERRIDLNASVAEEPEDIDFYGDTMLLNCGQKGGLYKIPGI
jgi:hypothetical protein